MTTEEQIREIKKELRASMNGILSAQMRQAGMPYKLVFGVELPRLQAIAAEFPCNRELAQALWNENIRECKILASLLMPHDEMFPEIADIWVDEMPTAEIAQICTMHLLSQEAWSAELAFQWIATNNTMRQLCGFLILARMLQQGAELNERAELELRDQAEALLDKSNLHLKKAIQATLGRLNQQKI